MTSCNHKLSSKSKPAYQAIQGDCTELLMISVYFEEKYLLDLVKISKKQEPFQDSVITTKSFLSQRLSYKRPCEQLLKLEEIVGNIRKKPRENVKRFLGKLEEIFVKKTFQRFLQELSENLEEIFGQIQKSKNQKIRKGLWKRRRAS